MSAKVVGWLEDYKESDVIFHYNGPKGVYGYGNGDKTGPHSGDPLVLESDHLAELEAARKAGRREAWEACDLLLRVEMIDPDDPEEAAYFDGIRECEIRIRALLPTPPTPEEQEQP